MHTNANCRACANAPMGSGTCFDSSSWGRKKTLRIDSHFAAKSADSASLFLQLLYKVDHDHASRPSEGAVAERSGSHTECQSFSDPLHPAHHIFTTVAKVKKHRLTLEGPVRRKRIALTHRRKRIDARTNSDVPLRVVTHTLCRNDLSLKRQASSVLELLLIGNTLLSPIYTTEMASCRQTVVRECLHLWTEFHRVCAHVLRTDLVYDFRCHCFVAFHAMSCGNQYSDFSGDTLTRRVHLLRKNQWLAANLDTTIEASSIGLRKGLLKECRRLFGIFIKHLAKVQSGRLIA
jgi:hypothetical protein